MGKYIRQGNRSFCDEPDRDQPKIKCGYPFPCPYHTAIVDMDDPNLVEKVEHLANVKRSR